MRCIRKPVEAKLFDESETWLEDKQLKLLREGWHHIFRTSLLALMPVEKLSKNFSPDLGRPTKELYSMAGLVLIKEFEDLTEAEAVHAYSLHSDVHYALNVLPGQRYVCLRTLQQYEKLFRDDELAKDVLRKVTSVLAEKLGLDVSQQRLDSTHIKSNMAAFGRVRLMSMCLVNFLEALQKQSPEAHGEIPEELRSRYAGTSGSIFGWKKLDDEAKQARRQQVADDLGWLVARFRDDPRCRDLPSHVMLSKVFGQQCEVVGDKIQVKEHPGGDVICNPSDPDATFSGHKGEGYHVQLCETSSRNNEVQLILCALPQTACESDAAALVPVIEDLQSQEFVPQALTADTAYGSDENHQHCAAQGIDLIAPVPGQCPAEHIDAETVTTADFQLEQREQIGEWGRVEQHPVCVACPAGRVPHRSFYSPSLEQLTILQHPEVCAECPLSKHCPKRYADGWVKVTIELKQTRLIKRRRHQQTADFRDKYRRRSGIESTNSGIKRVTGLGRLRVRGRAAVFNAVLLKVAGWNILRAASSRAMMDK